MKITMESTIKDEYAVTSSVEIIDSSDISETINAIAGCLVSFGFHPDSVLAGMDDYVVEHEEPSNG